MMSIELKLECPVPGCKEVPGGARWKTPLLLYEQAHYVLDLHLLYNHPYGQVGIMNELVPKVYLGDKDPKIEGEIMPLFNVSGLSERQPDHSSAGLQSNKTERKKKKTTWKKIAQKYKNEKKVRHDTSRYEVITDIKEWIVQLPFTSN